MVYRVYDSRNKSTSNMQPLQHSDANAIIVHPYKLLIIVNDCYTLRKPWIAILATLQLLRNPLRVVHLVYVSIKKSTSDMEPLQCSDANVIIVHPCKVVIIVHDCYTLRKRLWAIVATVQLSIIPLRVDTRSTTPKTNPQVTWSLCNILMHMASLYTLIIVYNCYKLRKCLIAVLAIVQLFKIPLSVVHEVYDSRNKSTSNFEPLQHSDANGIIVHPNYCPWLLQTQKAFNSCFSYITAFKNSIEGGTPGVWLQKQIQK